MSLPSCASVWGMQGSVHLPELGRGRAAVWVGGALGHIHASRLEGGTKNGSHHLCQPQLE